MTETVDTFQSLFDAMVAERGGLAALSAVNVEIVTECCRLLVAIRGTDAADVPKIAATIAQLQALLPSPVTADVQPIDLALLSDEELRQLEFLCRKGTGEIDAKPSPAEPERIQGPSEIVGRDLGEWIDAHAADWRLRDLAVAEALHLRNSFSSMASGFICRNLWADIYRADMQSEIKQAVRSALAAVGSDAKVLSAAETRRLVPPTNVHTQ
jgi:hypothetical protein